MSVSAPLPLVFAGSPDTGLGALQRCRFHQLRSAQPDRPARAHGIDRNAFAGHAQQICGCQPRGNPLNFRHQCPPGCFPKGAVTADPAAAAAGRTAQAGDFGAAGVVHRLITRHLLGQAGLKPDEADSGAVTLIQRFGSAANLNIHLHCWCSTACTGVAPTARRSSSKPPRQPMKRCRRCCTRSSPD